MSPRRSSPLMPWNLPTGVVRSRFARLSRYLMLLSSRSATFGAAGLSSSLAFGERARSPNANDDDKPAAPKVALLEDSNIKYLDNLANRDLTTPVGKFQGIKGELRRGDIGYGTGSGTGVGSAQNGVGATRGSNCLLYTSPSPRDS